MAGVGVAWRGVAWRRVERRRHHHGVGFVVALVERSWRARRRWFSRLALRGAFQRGVGVELVAWLVVVVALAAGRRRFVVGRVAWSRGVASRSVASRQARRIGVKRRVVVAWLSVGVASRCVAFVVAWRVAGLVELRGWFRRGWSRRSIVAS
ncbi:hypothetical protein ACXZ9C_11385 [Streptococcus agalactiae]